MEKVDVLAKLEEFKDRPIEIYCDNSIMLYANLPGHWVFTNDNELIEIAKNSSRGLAGVEGMSQNEAPFIITYTTFDMVQYIKGYIPPNSEKIKSIVSGMDPIGTDKSIDDVIKEICQDSIILANSPHGFQNDKRYYDDTYGQFSGTFISKDGKLPQGLLDSLGLNDDGTKKE